MSAVGKTTLKRGEQYRDRWTSFGAGTGLVSLSDRLSADELRRFPIFADYDDGFLEKISPDVSVAVWRAGSVLFEEGAYIDLAFFVADGEVEAFLQKDAAEAAAAAPIFDVSRTVAAVAPAPVPPAPDGRRPPTRPMPAASGEITFLATMDFDLPKGGSWTLGPGEIFGEIGALSGWPQSVTARTRGECRLVQIRIPALRLMKRRSSALKDRLDRLYRERSLALQLRSTPLFRGSNAFFLEGLKETVDLVSCEPDEVVAREGEPADAFYLVRSGFVKLLQRFGEGEMAVSYLSKGMTLGEVELLLDAGRRWQVTAVSVEHAELVKIPHDVFRRLLEADPSIEEQLVATALERMKEAGFSRYNVSHSDFTHVALESGLVQGSSILAIDLAACTRCDDCVRACAETHGGRPRFVREGNKYRNLLIAKSCYHCRDPVCLVGCPTGAIHRAGIAEVVEISDDVCIGCSTCANNCPYDAIVMHETGSRWPDDMLPAGLRGRDRLVASKCDLCHDTGHGPACVSNCPQGCAYRVGSLEDFRALLDGGPGRAG